MNWEFDNNLSEEVRLRKRLEIIINTINNYGIALLLGNDDINYIKFTYIDNVNEYSDPVLIGKTVRAVITDGFFDNLMNFEFDDTTGTITLPANHTIQKEIIVFYN